jgi:tryptophan-rich sensory protein
LPARDVNRPRDVALRSDAQERQTLHPRNIALFLGLAILATIVPFCRVDRLAGLLLVPYLLWVSFAAALNLAVWQLNA